MNTIPFSGKHVRVHSRRAQSENPSLTSWNSESTKVRHEVPDNPRDCYTSIFQVVIQAHTDLQKIIDLLQDFFLIPPKRSACMSLSPIPSFTDHSLEVNKCILIIHTISSFQMQKIEI